MASPLYLLSIDLEDIRLSVPDGERLTPRVVEPTMRYLEFFREQGITVTFFTVGNVARSYPDLIRRIIDEGHEIACHSDDHTPVTKLNAESFGQDLERCLESLYKAGATKVTGYRAPCFSITPRTPWAHEVLGRYGFTYSSSVLPAPNPVYGFAGFGETSRKVGGLLEIPQTLSPLPVLHVPFGGGIYFRVLPWLLLRYCFARKRQGIITGYFHPQDIDTEQERFMFPEIHDSRILNELMYARRGAVLGKIRKVLARGFGVMRYDAFADAWQA